MKLKALTEVILSEKGIISGNIIIPMWIVICMVKECTFCGNIKVDAFNYCNFWEQQLALREGRTDLTISYHEMQFWKW